MDLLTQTNTAITVICAATAAQLWERPQRAACTASANPAVSLTATLNHRHKQGAGISDINVPRYPSLMTLPAMAARGL